MSTRRHGYVKRENEMPRLVRKELGYKAQDAFHYLVQAGGKKADRKWGESAFTSYFNTKLSDRIAALTTGFERLADAVDICRPYFDKPIQFPFYVEPESEVEMEKRANQGINMVKNLCKRFGVMPAEGILEEERDW